MSSPRSATSGQRTLELVDDVDEIILAEEPLASVTERRTQPVHHRAADVLGALFEVHVLDVRLTE